MTRKSIAPSVTLPPRKESGEPLFRLMYSSVSINTLTQGQLADIFTVSIANNNRDHITGVLLADGRLNIQYLEGPEKLVQALWQRILVDTRHHCIVQLLEDRQSTAGRIFPDWAMLRGKTSRPEMLQLVRNAYSKLPLENRPIWASSVAPLMILLDSEYSSEYASAIHGADALS
ncbi:MAG: BLUF domain-containing protein [Brachymonas sp.]|nr:BLUF domain-containing protein [Brachymonas sp.]